MSFEMLGNTCSRQQTCRPFYSMMGGLSTRRLAQSYHHRWMTETQSYYCFVCDNNNEIKQSRSRCWTYYIKGYWICPGCIASINRDYRFECRDRRCMVDDDDVIWWHEAEVGLSLKKAMLKADLFFIQKDHGFKQR